MKIERDLAIQILKYRDHHKDFYFPFMVICVECSKEEDDFTEIEPSEWKLIENDNMYQTFELRENLQNLYKETVELMAQGFLEKTINSEKARNSIRNFIFYTTEGHTFQSNSKADIPDVENCQVLGWGKGGTIEDAFKNFKKESLWLDASGFNEVIGVELKNDKTYFFNLKN